VVLFLRLLAPIASVGFVLGGGLLYQPQEGQILWVFFGGGLSSAQNVIFGTVELSLGILKQLVETLSAEGVPALSQEARDPVPIVRVLPLTHAA